MLQVVLDKLGIKHGCITTIHNITNTQVCVWGGEDEGAFTQTRGVGF